MNDIENCKIENVVDENKNPTGGSVKGIGLNIEWQNGTLGIGEERKEPNGAFVETVISAALLRLEFFNESKFRCLENSLAITSLQEALFWLEYRTQSRERRGVEGIHKI